MLACVGSRFRRWQLLREEVIGSGNMGVFLVNNGNWIERDGIVKKMEQIRARLYVLRNR